jgi:signal peptidase II
MARESTETEIEPRVERPEAVLPSRGLPWGRVVVVLLLILLDQWSKTAVFEWLQGGEAEMVRDHHGHNRYPLLGEQFAFMLSLNRGAAFGRFGDFPHLLVIGRMIAVAVLIWLTLRADRRAWVNLSAMVLVLAGAAGNLLDNLAFGGVESDHPYRLVRDFIDVWFLSEAWGWDWHFPTFNVADSCISVGAVGWVFVSLFHRPEEEEAEPGEEPGESPGGSTEAPDSEEPTAPVL